MTAVLHKVSSVVRVEVSFLAMVPDDKNVDEQGARAGSVVYASTMVVRMLQHPEGRRKSLVLDVDVSVDWRVQLLALIQLQVTLAKTKKTPSRIVDIRVLACWDGR